MNDISCNKCRQCNTKGKPTAMRGSAYCDTHIKTEKQIDRSGLFTRFKSFLFEKRSKYDEEGKLKEFKKKGFREDYFYR